MGELILQEELDRAFDARFPKEMQVKLRSAKIAIAGLGRTGIKYCSDVSKKRDWKASAGGF